MSASLAALAATAALAAIHILSPRLRFLAGLPRSRWLSLAGGVSVAYVFVHILPELATAGQDLEALVGARGSIAEHGMYMAALLGLIAFYGLDKLALGSRQARARSGDHDQTGAGVFWLHILSFGLYNLVIGYLLQREERSLTDLAMFATAMALHFIVMDHGLHEHHKSLYRHRGRYVLALAIFGGWAVGLTATLPPLAVSGLFAVLAGGVVLNVLKEELPKEQESRFWIFALGSIAYGAILLAV